MYLKKLSLTNFKNYSQADYQFSDKINCFVGNNGVGKTNLMDAIYYLSFCKSYFNPIDSQNIRHQEDISPLMGPASVMTIRPTIFNVSRNGTTVRSFS